MGKPLEEARLRKLYLEQKFSSKKIAEILGCSEHKVNYWLLAYNIPKRSISEAIYVHYNPRGDPFKFIPPRNLKESELFGLGLGLYWGEGNKANKNIVKLGNSDPDLLLTFMNFLIRFFRIKKSDLKFHLQIFTDIKLGEAMRYWTKKLNIRKEQIYKPFITKSGSIGTYRNKSRYGVFTLYYANTKLRNLIIGLIDRSRKTDDNSFRKPA